MRLVDWKSISLTISIAFVAYQLFSALCLHNLETKSLQVNILLNWIFFAPASFIALMPLIMLTTIFWPAILCFYKIPPEFKMFKSNIYINRCRWILKRRHCNVKTKQNKKSRDLSWWMEMVTKIGRIWRHLSKKKVDEWKSSLRFTTLMNLSRPQCSFQEGSASIRWQCWPILNHVHHLVIVRLMWNVVWLYE